MSAWLNLRAAAESRGVAVEFALRDFCARHALSRSTLLRWCRAARGGLDALAHAPRSGRPSALMSPPAWEMLLSLWLDPRRPSLRSCYERVAVAAARSDWSWPAYVVIARRVRRECPPAIACYHRDGPRRWARQYAPRVERDYAAVQPNQCWVGDHHTCDVWVQHRGRAIRPTLTAWMDLRSRRCVGWWIGPAPHTDAIFAAFAAAVRDHGAPTELLIDNGKDYRAADLTGGRTRGAAVDCKAPLCSAGAAGPPSSARTVLTPAQRRAAAIQPLADRLGIEVHFTWPYAPDSKPIERWFRTVCEDFSKTWDSYCGGAPERRPESLTADLRAGRVTLPTLDHFSATFQTWLDAVYHVRPHSGRGMDGRSPLQAFTDNPIARRTAPADVLADLLTREAVVPVTRHGVRVRGVDRFGWGDAALLRWIGHDVRVRYQPADLSRVEVFSLDGRPIAVLTRRELTGVVADDLRDGLKRQRAARRAARAARPQDADRFRTPAELAIREMAQRQQQLAATGTDDAVAAPAPPRNLAPLFPNAGPGVQSSALPRPGLQSSALPSPRPGLQSSALPSPRPGLQSSALPSPGPQSSALRPCLSALDDDWDVVFTPRRPLEEDCDVILPSPPPLDDDDDWDVPATLAAPPAASDIDTWVDDAP